MALAVFPSVLWAQGLALSSPKGINDANRLYAKGEYDKAAAVYQKAVRSGDKNFLARYDLGTALYKKGDFDKSAGYLQQALAAKDPNVRLKAQYNLGNALYKVGMAQEDKNIDGAIASLEKSFGNYDDVIKADAKDADARYNRDIVQKELERLKKKKKKQDQQKNQNGQGQQNKQDQSQQERPKDQGKDGQQRDQPKQEDQQGQQQGGQEQQKDQSEQQAKSLLQEYERTEAPQGLLNFIPKGGKEQDVDKDW